jgi:anaerobic magnesium-protoporphyrin IX monomethyl ester cyclase
VKIAIIEPLLKTNKNIIRDVIYGCWCGGKRIGGATVPPFEQLTIATILQNDGHDVTFIDAQMEQLDISEILSRVHGCRLVITSTSVMTMNDDAAFVSRIRQDMPEVKFAAYGSHPTFEPLETLKKGYDFAVQREPEWVLRDLARLLDQNKTAEISALLGLATLDEKGALIKNKRYPFIDDLDQIPAVDVTMLSPDYVYFNPIVRHLPYMTVSSSHGCPAKCSYCTAPFFHGTRTRFASASKVVADIEFYLSHGIREIYFRDETFTADRQRVIDICQSILDKGLDFTWICNSRVDTIDRDLVFLMKKAGCHLIKFGAESGNQQILDNVKKGITLDQSRKAFQWCKEAAMDTHAHFMIGMPGETHDTMEETLAFACEIEPSTVTFGICTPYPGTPLFRDIFRLDNGIGDGADNAAIERLHTEGDYNNLVCSVEGVELNKTIKRFYRRFYLRPSYIFRSLQRIRSGNMLRNMVIGGFNVVSFAVSKKAT